MFIHIVSSQLSKISLICLLFGPELSTNNVELCFIVLSTFCVSVVRPIFGIIRCYACKITHVSLSNLGIFVHGKGLSSIIRYCAFIMFSMPRYDSGLKRNDPVLSNSTLNKQSVAIGTLQNFELPICCHVNRHQSCSL